MLAPLRNPSFNVCTLVALFSAPMVFRCHAHPLRDDLSIGVDGGLVRSDTTHSLGIRMDADNEDNDPPPAYSPGPSNDNNADNDDGNYYYSDDDDRDYNYDNGADYSDDDNGVDYNDSDENDSTYSYSDSDNNNSDNDNDPPRYTFEVHSVTEVNEVEGTAKINDFKDVLLQANPADLGKNDHEKLSRKYYVVDPNHASDEVEKPAVLKIVDLLKAEKLAEHAPSLLIKEGEYWKKGEGNMFLWQTDEPIKILDGNGQVVQWVYMVMYRATHNGLLFNPDSNRHLSKPLRYVGEWYGTWKKGTKREVEYTLGLCKYNAMKTHKRLAEEGMEIDDYNLNKWVTDEDCKHWLPNEINVAFSYRVELGDGTTKRALVRGAKELELNSESDYDTHFERVQTQLNDKFTSHSVKEHEKQWLKMKAKSRA